jgi:hypothetical protein
VSRFLSPDDLTDAEQQVREAFALGERVDLGGRPIRAELLAGLLSDTPGTSALRLSNAVITDRLDLEGRNVQQLIDLRACVFEQAPDLRMAKLVGLRLHTCRTPGMLARNLRVDSDLILEPRFVCDGTLDLTDATVDGSLRLTDAVLRGKKGDALLGARMNVRGSIKALALRATGVIRLPGANVGGNLHLAGAQLSNPGGDALTASGLVVEGSVLANPAAGRFTAAGRISLPGARVGGNVVFTGARLTAAVPLDCDRIRVEGSIVLDRGFVADGPIRLADGRVGGYLRITGATLGQKDSVREPNGEPRAPVALFGDGIELGGDLDARAGAAAGRPDIEPLVAYGQIRLPGAKIDGSASFSGARLHCPGRDALFADRLTVGESLFLHSVRVTGSVRLQNSRIAATLDCSHSTFTQPRRRADGSRKPSLDIQFAAIGHNLLCGREVVATGGVNVRLAEIRNTVYLSEAVLGDGEPDSVALDSYGLVAHRLVVRFPGQPPKGLVRLGKARVGVLSDGPGLWAAAGGLDIGDFAYDSIAPESGVPVKTRLRWLREVQPDFAPGPYDHLVSVYRNAGEEELAERVQLEKQRRRHAELGWAGRVWGVVQEWTVGYGYRPWVAAVWLAVFWLLGTLWFAFNMMEKLDSDQNPVWNPPLLAMDLLLPIIDLGQDNMWRMVGPSQWLADVLIAAGWILATTVAAGTTRVLKRG